MNRYVKILCAGLGFLFAMEGAKACASGLLYGGYYPCLHCFAKKKDKCAMEELRLNRFWHDFYDVHKQYYGALSHVDWVAYYKNHGYPVPAQGACGGTQRVQFAPVFISPNMHWAIPGPAPETPPCDHCAPAGLPFP